MIAIDSNILVRIITQDDPSQTRRAAALLRGKEPVFVPKTVLLEIEWVLRKTYKTPRGEVLRAFRQLLETSNLEVEDEPAISKAIEWYEAGMDFADALHVASSGPHPTFATFDKDLRRKLTRIASAKPAEF